MNDLKPLLCSFCEEPDNQCWCLRPVRKGHGSHQVPLEMIYLRAAKVGASSTQWAAFWKLEELGFWDLSVEALAQRNWPEGWFRTLARGL